MKSVIDKIIGLNTRHWCPALLFYIDLSLADSEHLGAAYRTCPLRRRLAVLHGDSLGVLNLSLGATLDTITLHLMSLLFYLKDSLFLASCQ